MSDRGGPQKPGSTMADGKHPLYKVWFVQGRLRALDHSLDQPGKLDERSIRQSLNVLANMLDEWLTEQGITERE